MNNEEKILSSLEALTRGMAEMQNQFTGRLDGIDGRLDGIDGRLDGIDGRLDGVDGRLDAIEKDVTKIKDDMEELKEDAKVTRAATEELIAWADEPGIHNAALSKLLT